MVGSVRELVAEIEHLNNALSLSKNELKSWTDAFPGLSPLEAKRAAEKGNRIELDEEDISSMFVTVKSLSDKLTADKIFVAYL